MKITIEGTDDQRGKSVTIEIPGDDTPMFAPEGSTVVDDLLKPVLVAWGFHPNTVTEAFVEDV